MRHSPFVQLRNLWDSNPVRYWVIAFVLFNFSNVNGFSNPMSRMATLAAMSEDSSFKIDPYIERYGWTEDWAQTPDGAYYSNKAPGPMLLGYLPYKVMDWVATLGADGREQRDTRRYKARYAEMYVLSFLFQVIPFAILALLFGRWLQQRGIKGGALHFGGAAMLLGTTASMFMNTYFGHGMAAAAVAGTAYCLIRGHWLGYGLFFGLAMLADYSTAALVPALLLGLLASRQASASNTSVRLLRVMTGGLLPLVLWSAYHWICFGSPFTTSNEFQNPAFTGYAKSSYSLWGVLRLIPDPRVAMELLIGPSRGLLFTQPWLLLVLAFAIPHALRWRSRSAELTKLAVFSLAALAGLLLMNACFSGWDGGGTPGPRYISSILPMFGILGALLYPAISRTVRALLWAGLAASIALLILSYSTFIVVPNEPLWPLYFQMLANEPTWVPAARIASLGLVLTGIAVWALRETKTTRPS